MLEHQNKVQTINSQVQQLKTREDVKFQEENKFGSQHMESVMHEKEEHRLSNMNLMEEYMLDRDMLQEKLEATEKKTAEAASITANPQYRNASKKSEERQKFNKATKEGQFANQAKQSFTTALEKAKELETLKKPEAAGELTKEQRKAERARISKIEEVLKYRTEGQIYNIQYKASKNDYGKKELDFKIKKAKISSILFLKKEVQSSRLTDAEKEAKCKELDKQVEALNSFKWEKEEAKAKEKANTPKSKHGAGRWIYEIGRIFTLNYGIVGGIIADHCMNKLDKIKNAQIEFGDFIENSQVEELESNASAIAAQQTQNQKPSLDRFIEFNQKVQQAATFQNVKWNSIGKGIVKGFKWFGVGAKYAFLGATAPIWGVPYLIHNAVTTAQKIKAGPDVPDFMDSTVYDNHEEQQQQ